MRTIATLAIGTITMLFLGLVSLQYQLERTQGLITISGRTGDAFNLSKAITADTTNTLGVSVPGFFTAAIVAFLAVLLLVSLS